MSKKEELLKYLKDHEPSERHSAMVLVNRQYIIDIIEELAEPTKIKVPIDVLMVVNKYKNEKPEITFYELINLICTSDIETPEYEVKRWLQDSKENESILMKVLFADGCIEIEKNKIWIVSDDNGKCFCKFTGEGVSGVWASSNIIPYMFDEKEKAEAVALLTGGTVELV